MVLPMTLSLNSAPAALHEKKIHICYLLQPEKAFATCNQWYHSTKKT
jgi:hypothetical protein